MGVRNVVPIHDIVKPDIFEDKIELISTCEMSIDELKAFALVLKYAAVVMKKDGITKESIKKASVVFLGGDELIIDEEDEKCCASTFSLIILNIPVRQHRKSGRRETVCPGLRKPLMRVYSRNVLSKP